jgi:hypothetical protein
MRSPTDGRIAEPLVFVKTKVEVTLSAKKNTTPEIPPPTTVVTYPMKSKKCGRYFGSLIASFMSLAHHCVQYMVAPSIPMPNMLRTNRAAGDVTSGIQFKKLTPNASAPPNA